MVIVTFFILCRVSNDHIYVTSGIQNNHRCLRVVTYCHLPFPDILQFIRSFTPFVDEDFEEIIRHMAGLHLVPAIEGGLGQSELFKKLRLLGVKKEKISIVIAPWQAAKSEPDFILCAKIFRQGSTHFS